MRADGLVLPQPSRHRPPLVPDPSESCEAPGVRPVQVADHQDRDGPAAAGHPGPVPLQHARLHGEEDAGSLRAEPGRHSFDHFFLSFLFILGVPYATTLIWPLFVLFPPKCRV